jgi:hypothetical protein
MIGPDQVSVFSRSTQVLYQLEHAEEKEVVRACYCNSKAAFPGFGNPFQLYSFRACNFTQGVFVASVALSNDLLITKVFVRRES